MFILFSIVSYIYSCILSLCCLLLSCAFLFIIKSFIYRSPHFSYSIKLFIAAFFLYLLTHSLVISESGDNVPGFVIDFDASLFKSLASTDVKYSLENRIRVTILGYLVGLLTAFFLLLIMAFIKKKYIFSLLVVRLAVGATFKVAILVLPILVNGLLLWSFLSSVKVGLFALTPAVIKQLDIIFESQFPRMLITFKDNERTVEYRNMLTNQEYVVTEMPEDLAKKVKDAELKGLKEYYYYSSFMKIAHGYDGGQFTRSQLEENYRSEYANAELEFAKSLFLFVVTAGICLIRLN